jgi:nucleotide-binding universal stress UspA family protein
MKILLAVDGSRYTKKMLVYLATHAPLFAAEHAYALLNVQAPLPSRIKSAVGSAAAHDFHQAEAERVLAPAFKFLARHGLNPSSHWKLGHPAETIAQFAQSGAFDLLVMGSHGHGALGNLVLGSVSTQVLAQSTTPLLLVR